MKKTTTIIAIFLLIISVQGQTRYQKEMQKTVLELNKASELQDFKKLSNQFERIANIENKKWLPFYYASYCYTVMSRFDEEKTEQRDLVVDKAEALLEKASKLSPENEEITVLKGYIAQSRFFIAPASRIPSFAKTSRVIANAVELYPNNPRANVVQGIQIYHKPAFLGGGAAKATPYFTKATRLFQLKSDSLKIQPHWGKKKNIAYLKRYKNN